MRVFVSGSTGVIGRRVVSLLRAAGHDVTGMLHARRGVVELERAGATTVKADLMDFDSLLRAVDSHEVVINLATHIPQPTLLTFVPAAWQENDRIRRDGSANLARAAVQAGAQRFIQESFAPVYPDRGEHWIHETEPLEPVSFNRTVADAELSAERFSQSGGTGVVLRFAAFYGPDARQLQDFVLMARLGIAPLLGPSESFISSISHDDAAAAVMTALHVPAGIYNVGDDDPVTHRDYANALADAMRLARSPKLPPPWAANLAGPVGKLLARSVRISNMKLRNAGWTPKFRSVREGFATTLAEMESKAHARAA